MDYRIDIVRQGLYGLGRLCVSEAREHMKRVVQATLTGEPPARMNTMTLLRKKLAEAHDAKQYQTGRENVEQEPPRGPLFVNSEWSGQGGDSGEVELEQAQAESVAPQGPEEVASDGPFPVGHDAGGLSKHGAGHRRDSHGRFVHNPI